MSSSQYSYFAILGSGNSISNTMIKIDTAQGPSRTSNNLFIGDTISVGVGGTLNNYYIRDIGLTNAFFINSGLLASDLAPSAVVIATRSAQHIATFSPQDNSAGGHWQFLLRATSTAGENSSDGLPDQNGFDSKLLSAANVTCPWGATASVGTTTMLAVGNTNANSQAYHIVDCVLGTGLTNPVGIGLTGTIIIGTQVSGFINPSPSHAASQEGNADVYTYLVRQTDSSNNLIDQAVGRLAIVESVRITATVDSTISFYIDNIGVTNPGAIVCGTAASQGALVSTGDTVSFGSLSINAFNQLSQRLSCVTNGRVGYVVTAYESAPLHNITTGTTIADTDCDGSCSINTTAPWTTDTTHSEFGYSLENITGSQAAFTNTTGYRPFGVSSANAQIIMSRNSTPPQTDQVRLCYRITASTSQEAGDYEAKVVYTATATF